MDIPIIYSYVCHGMKTLFSAWLAWLELGLQLDNYIRHVLHILNGLNFHKTRCTKWTLWYSVSGCSVAYQTYPISPSMKGLNCSVEKSSIPWITPWWAVKMQQNSSRERGLLWSGSINQPSILQQKLPNATVCRSQHDLLSLKEF